ncbi:MAG: tRNA (adenosine(37)-N6)-threonylcarbamoyltransferase complex transferase subunit TsaD [Clostridia bacterium]|nr:tRNA (adenosine(37)-N6)-threonylcarbamoyltransferase complex transferase subunit TsaD [Clostridia bacterium]
MKILAIESSCDDTSAAVVEDGRWVLSNVVASQVEEHVLYGGVVPEIASRRHTEAICAVVKKALDDASVGVSDCGAVAVTAAPGLIGSLLVGVNFAKGLAFSARKPLIPVHHLRGHIAANYLTHTQLEPPFMALVVSGGHTAIVDVAGYTDLRLLGTTLDDAAGESLDKAARTLGFDYPGGANMDRYCAHGDADFFRFPHPRIDGLDMSFSGLKTKMINLVHNIKQQGGEINAADLGASYMLDVARILCDKVMLAASTYRPRALAVAGGVAANSVLRRELDRRCREAGLKLYFPDLSYCGDNAAMIGAQAYYEESLTGDEALVLNARATMELSESFKEN